jgi:hypothetical protein
MTVGSDGYTLIEEYANWLGMPHARAQNNARSTLTWWRSPGASKSVSPTCSVTGASKGTVVLQSDGHTARFTPSSGITGLGAFSFTVKGSDGTSWTSSVSVLLEPGTTAIRGMDVPGTSGVAPAWVDWLDAQGRVLLRETQMLDQRNPRPATPARLHGLGIASITFQGEAPRAIRVLGVAP